MMTKSDVVIAAAPTWIAGTLIFGKYIFATTNSWLLIIQIAVLVGFLVSLGTLAVTIPSMRRGDERPVSFGAWIWGVSAACLLYIFDSRAIARNDAYDRLGLWLVFWFGFLEVLWFGISVTVFRWFAVPKQRWNLPATVLAFWGLFFSLVTAGLSSAGGSEEFFLAVGITQWSLTVVFGCAERPSEALRLWRRLHTGTILLIRRSWAAATRLLRITYPKCRKLMAKLAAHWTARKARGGELQTEAQSKLERAKQACLNHVRIAETDLKLVESQISQLERSSLEPAMIEEEIAVLSRRKQELLQRLVSLRKSLAEIV